MGRALLFVPTCLVAALFADPAAAQVDRCAGYQRLLDAAAANPGMPTAQALVDIGATPRCLVIFLGEESAFHEVVRRFESSRSDRQAGATSVASGSTSVVAHGATAKVLSVAAEYGALTQATKDRVVTFRGNLAGLPAALVRRDVVPYCVESDQVSGYCVRRSLLSALRRVSFGVSFDPSRTTTLTAMSATPAAPAQPVTFTGSGGEISALNVRIDLVNERDATSPAFRAKWKEKARAAGDGAADELLKAGSFIADVMNLDGYDDWQQRTARAIVEAGIRSCVPSVARDNCRAEIVAAFTVALQELAANIRAMPGNREQLAALSGAYNRFFLVQDDLIETLTTATVVAVEYTNSRPASQPSTANYRAIVDYATSKTTKLVVNMALTHYDSRPADGVGGRLRDLQAGVAVNRVLGGSLLGPAVASLAGYYQYQRAAAILKVDGAQPLPGVTFTGLPAGTKEVFTKTGDIWLAQAKLTLTPPNSSTTIPVSVTYSNRTELVDKPAWRGQIGLSYNMDALMASLAR